MVSRPLFLGFSLLSCVSREHSGDSEVNGFSIPQMQKLQSLMNECTSLYIKSFKNIINIK